jgi:hypothetical protein
MKLLTPAILMTALLSVHAQDKPQAVILPVIQQPDIPVVPVSQRTHGELKTATLGEPKTVTLTTRMQLAVYNGTVYIKVGDMVVPMDGTAGCFTPKEILKAGDPRLHFERETDVPPPPPAPVKQ